MLTEETLTDCRFCSLVSKQNGEDPIGTARFIDHWLILELAQPWTPEMFREDSRIAPLVELFKQLFMKHGVMMQPVLIAPDKEYSRTGEARVIYYRRPHIQFAQYDKQEFIVPEAEVTRLVTALLKHLMKQPNQFSAFRHYRQETSHIREILVCTHGNVDAACARFGYPIYTSLRHEYAGTAEDKRQAADSGCNSQNAAAHSISYPTCSQLRVWRCSHFGGHKFAPTLIDLPDGRYWGHLELDVLDGLIHRQGDVSQLLSHYRGWSGLRKFEQIAEREIWMQVGWEWFSCQQSGKTTGKGLRGIKRYLYPILRWVPLKQVQAFLEQWTNDATWAEVQIHFTNPAQKTSGLYQARVEVCGEVMTAAKSPNAGEEMSLNPVPQYRVSRLQKKPVM